MKRVPFSALLLVLASAPALGPTACAGRTETSDPSSGGTSGGAGKAGAAGTGGSAGKAGAAGFGGIGGNGGLAGAGGLAGSGGSGGSSTVIQCGKATCRAPVLGQAPPCCAAGGKCGLSVAGVCQELDSPGDPDDACSPPGGGIRFGNACTPLAGCRKRDKSCGVLLDFPIFGLTLGCVVLPPASQGLLQPCLVDGGLPDASLLDAGKDASVDASKDASVDAGKDASRDASNDAPRDARRD